MEGGEGEIGWRKEVGRVEWQVKDSTSGEA